MTNRRWGNDTPPPIKMVLVARLNGFGGGRALFPPEAAFLSLPSCFELLSFLFIPGTHRNDARGCLASPFTIRTMIKKGPSFN